MDYELYDNLDFAMCERTNELNYGITARQFTNQIYDMLFYNSNKTKNEPFKVVYRSKPIKGIVLELVTINQNYI